MNDQTIKDVTALRLQAQELRRDARKPENEGARKQFLEAAAATLTRAISKLQRELRTLESEASGDRGKLRELLSQTMGSLGGTYRDAKDYDSALKAYEAGNDVEEKRRKEDGHLDSYNLVQRLVVDLLPRPSLLDEPDFKRKLEAARIELERQFNLGRRDGWFLADAILVRFLNREPAEEILSDLESRKLEASFYESTHEAVSALLNEGLGRSSPLEEQLQRFRQMLQRRGGLKTVS